MARSILAVFAGLCCIVALSLAADAAVWALLPRAFRGPEGGGAVGLLLLTLAYVAFATALGGYLTALVAAREPTRHAVALGALSLALMVAATPFAWDSAPVWFHVASLVLVVPAAWLGGRLEARGAMYPHRARAG